MSQPLVVSFGGGSDSTAMLLLFRERGIVPDRIQFADTGNRDAEKPETYEHVDRMDALCRDWWGVPITLVRTSGMYAGLEDNCLRKKMLPSRAYGFSSCSQKYKHQPMEKDLNNWEPARVWWKTGDKVRKAIGYNYNESHRSHDITEDAKYSYWYPLIEWRITRQMVRDICRERLGYLPMKSACFYCPSSKPHEVVWLQKNHPDLFARAVAMEHNAAANLVNIKGLGRHWSFEEVGAAGEAQVDLFADTVDIPCMCFDGEGEDE